jgi:two-component system CheB/CheR fusion protein
MPKTAVETGIVDLVLPPQEMGPALARFIANGTAGPTAMPPGESLSADDGAMSTIFKLLRLECGIDFSSYKKNTVQRRIERRLQMLRASSLEDYVERLRTDAEERNHLYKDLLIGVTKFFRDTEAFGILARQVLPKLFEQTQAGGEIRFWVAGCATGEEAYSLAMLVQEQLDETPKPIDVKIFATDVHHTSLDFARAAVYAPEALSEVSAERIERFFVRLGDNYQVSPDLRQLIVFAPHNVIKDAPFTKIDLISCRNLLIYLEPAAQEKVLSLFHFALNTGGVLFLGSSESPADLSDEFESINRHWKIYGKRRDTPFRPKLPLMLPSEFRGVRTDGPYCGSAPRSSVDQRLLSAYESLVRDHGPPSFVLGDQHRLLYTFPGASRYLRVQDGEPSNDLLELVAPELRVAIAGAVQRCARQQTAVTFTGVRIEADPGQEPELVRLLVKPLTSQDGHDPRFLVSLVPMETAEPVTDREADEPMDLDEAARMRVDALETELRHARENLQATIEELEASNEELQATNEELVASNEELQSTNEELHSVNEELYTVNAEHQKKVDELSELTDDMDNLFRATDIGTIFLDEHLCIRKFTPKASHNFQILPQDVGRRIDSFTHNLVYADLFRDVQRVADGDLANVQRDVVDSHGTWYFLRVLPYRSRKGAGGVLLSLVDISTLKAAQHEVHVAYDALKSSLNGTVIADFDWEIQYANPAFSAMFGLGDPASLVGRRLSELFLAENVKRLTEICSNSDEIRSAPVDYTIRRPDGSMLAVDVRSCVVSDENGKAHGRMVSFIDITKRKKAEQQRERYARDLESANETLRRAKQGALESVRNRDRFLATLSHELRNPLAGLLNAQRVLEHDEATAEDIENATGAIKRQAEHMSRLLDDLLDVARVTRGKIHFQKEVFDARELIPDAVQAIEGQLLGKGQELQVDRPDNPVFIEGDPARILQVLENLLNNASKYTPDGGSIELRLAESDGSCRVTVRDSGRGIKPEMLDKIFDLFVQADETLDRRDGGMGVGLTLVRSLVEIHGGTVAAHSQGEGKGSEFTVVLPTATCEPKDGPVEADSPPIDRSEDGHRVVEQENKAALGAAKVLLVEDNLDAAQMLRTLLELDGYQVEVAEDGQSGLDALLERPPDVALIDIGLPVMDGFEIARRVRRERNDRAIHLVALTGYGQRRDRAAVLKAGFDEHLVKPVDMHHLRRVLDQPRKTE